jgi:hypothetical protein
MSHDTEAIGRLLATQCHRLDRGTPDEVASLFLPDAVLRPRFDGAYIVTGRDAIRRWYRHYEGALRSNVRHLRHMLHSAAIDVRDSEATAKAYFTAAFIGGDGKARTAFGLYEDRLANVGGEWLFVEHTIDASFTMTAAETSETFSPLGYVAE